MKTILISFSVETKKFESNTERNKFFRELYGWKQIVTKNDRKYIYDREGLLDEMPHIKVDKSIFIIEKKFEHMMAQFLKDWENKIKWNVFDVLLNEKQKEILKGCFDEG